MSTTLKQKRRQKRRQRQLRPQTQAQSTAQPPKAFLLLEIFFRSKQLQIATTLLSTLVLLAIFMPNFFQGIQQATVAFGEQTQTVEESERSPDSFGTNMLLQTFAADGTLQYQVRAESMQQYLDAKSTNLQTPFITLNNQGSSPWTIKAQDGLIRPAKGTLDENEKVLLLNGAVSVTQNLSSDDYVRLSSDDLTVYPASKIARTEQFVIVETSAFKTQALGVIVDLSSGRIEFPKNDRQRVKSTLIPTPAFEGKI
jgi:LPS export ABC transporter protein LptC